MFGRNYVSLKFHLVKTHNFWKIDRLSIRCLQYSLYETQDIIFDIYYKTFQNVKKTDQL